jgi:predicted enzyme related to lactoylglutathione lyase
VSFVHNEAHLFCFRAINKPRIIDFARDRQRYQQAKEENTMSEQSQSMPANGTFCWNELGTTNFEAASNFYTSLFDWKLKDSSVEGMAYHQFMADGGRMLGGMYQMTAECGDKPSQWTPYVAVEDVDAKAKQVEALGGKICVPPTDIPTVGRFCVINDPTGATLSLIKFEQPKSAA